jgi:hypothetical protein
MSETDAMSLLSKGMKAYRFGNYAQAIQQLGQAVQARPTASWARDARVLRGAAQVMLTSPAQIPSLGVGIASLDAAAQRAAQHGDSQRAAFAQLAAARRSRGKFAKNRWCSLKDVGSLPPQFRQEAHQKCSKD